MKKLLPVFLMCLSLVAFQPLNAEACKKGGCGSSWGQKKASKCKISKLKKMTKMLYMHRHQLELTEEQIEKMKTVKHSAVKKMIQLKADKDILMVDLKSEMWADQIDSDKVTAMVDQKYSIKANAAKTYVQAVADIQQILNADQRAMAKEMAMSMKMGSGCSKYSASDGKVCPITGKPLMGKGSSKGSMK